YRRRGIHAELGTERISAGRETPAGEAGLGGRAAELVGPCHDEVARRVRGHGRTTRAPGVGVDAKLGAHRSARRGKTLANDVRGNVPEISPDHDEIACGVSSHGSGRLRKSPVRIHQEFRALWHA